jgi:eukaryotic-like serine/threonine-protein kinase
MVYARRAMRRVVEESTVPRGQSTPRQGAAPPSRPSPPPAPKQLGRYQVLFELARGGIGTVYAARLTGAHGFDRLVAIKRLSGGGASEEDVAAFLAEARLTARIRHANVVQTLELVEEDGAPFIVMQLVEGVSLARLLRRLADQGDALDPHLAAWIVAQAANGLHAAHELRGSDDQPLGLVHRDVSPENVMLSYDGRVYVADFGVAKLTESVRSTRSGVVKGKFAYMSPEQTRAGALDRRSDVFSLGVVLHEALAGQRLFAGSSPADTIRRVGEDQAPDPRDQRPDLPPELVPIALRCLEKRREDRHATAGELAEALRRFLRDSRVPVDEADLAETLAARFAEERDRLRSRIQAALAADPDRPLDDVSAERELTVSVAGRSGTGSVTAAIHTAPPRTRRLLGGGVLLAGAVALAALAIWLARGGQAEPRAPEDAPAPTATQAAVPTAAAAPTSSAEVAPPSEHPAAPTATATAAPVAKASAEPAVGVKPAPPTPAGASKRPRAPVSPTPPGTGAAPPAAPQAPSPSASSHKGVPFRDL